MEQAKLEFERIESLKYKKKSTVKLTKNRSYVSKPKEPTSTGPYANIKSRLFKSIESSRQKERDKFHNDELARKALLLKNQKSSNKENQPVD